MSWLFGDNATGATYYHTTTLPVGVHTYSFVCSDGIATNSTETLEGPIVNDWVNIGNGYFTFSNTTTWSPLESGWFVFNSEEEGYKPPPSPPKHTLVINPKNDLGESITALVTLRGDGIQQEQTGNSVSFFLSGDKEYTITVTKDNHKTWTATIFLDRDKTISTSNEEITSPKMDPTYLVLSLFIIGLFFIVIKSTAKKKKKYNIHIKRNPLFMLKKKRKRKKKKYNIGIENERKKS